MISAKIIADSIANGVRLTTMELNYPRFIHAEAKTHRIISLDDEEYELILKQDVDLMDDPMLSRNASSSRAIPIEKMLEQVRQSPAMPVHWGKNQSGMQAREETNASVVMDWDYYNDCEYIGTREEAWIEASKNAVAKARAFNCAGYHKQIVNRLLEPFQYIKVIVTATEWDNFFKLRLHKDSQPEIRELARCMKQAMENSSPKELLPGEWHLPLSMEGDLLTKIKTSVAGAARISYNNHDGSNRTIEKDINLHNQLLISGHMSPFEHCLTPMCNEELYNCQLASEFIGQQAYFRANFNRWTSYRWILENKDESYRTVG